MRALYYGVKNLATNKIDNVGCSSGTHNARQAAEGKLSELKLINPDGEYKIVNFFGKI